MSISYSRLSRVIAVANGKGGVFKSSLAANMAGLTAAGGYRTLLIDLDPQGDLADDLGFFNDDRDDHGQHLATALLTGGPLRPTITEIRPNLDIVTGGAALGDVAGGLLNRSARGASTTDLLAKALEPTASDYALIIIDTPPIDQNLQAIAMGAARWLIVPSRSDASSIRGIYTIAERLIAARTSTHPIDLLGVVLAGVPSRASRIREAAEGDIKQILGDVDALVPHLIRESASSARECRDRGKLAHEMAVEVEGAEPYWAALRNGGVPQRLPGSAPALADDYVRVTEHLLKRLHQHEHPEETP